MKTVMFKTIANALKAIDNNIESQERGEDFHQRQYWIDSFTDRIEYLVKEYAPSGSGYNSGTTIDFDETSVKEKDENGNFIPQKLVFNTAFYVDTQYEPDFFEDEEDIEVVNFHGWTHWKVTVTPSLWETFHIEMELTSDDAGVSDDECEMDFIQEMMHQDFDAFLTMEFDNHDSRFLPRDQRPETFEEACNSIHVNAKEFIKDVLTGN